MNTPLCALCCDLGNLDYTSNIHFKKSVSFMGVPNTRATLR